mmetsp:Transcript_29999/g.63261  ORF Transcript_29999/g.63261 Transcript_29999/m.63261 type:complete len:506 (-) Transcript_29999:156-1673(-)
MPGSQGKGGGARYTYAAHPSASRRARIGWVARADASMGGARGQKREVRKKNETDVCLVSRWEVGSAACGSLWALHSKSALLGFLLELRVHVVVGRAAVLGNVHAGVLNLGRHAEDACELEREEHDRGPEGDPRDDGDERDDGAAEHLAAAEEEAGVVGRGVVSPRVVAARVVRVAEETGGEDAPEAAAAVDGKGVERVVDSQLVHHELGGAKVDKAAEDADGEGVPRRNDGAAGSDGDEAREHAVAHHGHVPRVRGEELVEQHDGEAARSGGERGRHDDTRHRLRVARASEREGRAGVEAVPAEPKDEGAEHAEHGRVAGHGDDALVLVVAALARAHDECAPEGGDAASHMHNAGSGKVNAAAEHDVVLDSGEGGEPAASRPDPVHNDRVDPASDDAGVDEVGTELRALSDGAGHDGGGGSSKAVLEPPEREIVAGRMLIFSSPPGREEGVAALILAGVGRTDKTIRVRPAVVRNAKAPSPPDECTDTSIKQVLEKNVFGILCSH